MNRSQLLTVFLVLAAIIGVIQSRPDHRFHLWVLDVGQGDAIFIQTPGNRQILIDGGPTDAVLPELGRHMPFWDRSIDLVILTHNHADHLSGLIEVARRYQIGEVWLSGAIHTTPEYQSWLDVLRDRQIPTKIVWAGKTDDLDQVHLRVLFPLTNQTGVRPQNQHDANIVTKLTIDHHSVLLTGDIEEPHETALVAADCPNGPTVCPALQADVLKEPHHGSRTGLLPAFLEAVHTSVAVISCGLKNPYGHPAPAILERLRAAKVTIFRTDQQGTIRVDERPNGFVVQPEPI